MEEIFDNLSDYAIGVGTLVFILFPVLSGLYKWLKKQNASWSRKQAERKAETERQLKVGIEQLKQEAKEAAKEAKKAVERERANLEQRFAEAERQLEVGKKQYAKLKQETKEIVERMRLKQEAETASFSIPLWLEAASRSSNVDEREALMEDLKELSIKNIRAILENDKDKKDMFNKLAQYAKSNQSKDDDSA